MSGKYLVIIVFIPTCLACSDRSLSCYFSCVCKMETEADFIGMQLMAKACFDPNEMPEVCPHRFNIFLGASLSMPPCRIELTTPPEKTVGNATLSRGRVTLDGAMLWNVLVGTRFSFFVRDGRGFRAEPCWVHLWGFTSTSPRPPGFVQQGNTYYTAVQRRAYGSCTCDICALLAGRGAARLAIDILRSIQMTGSHIPHFPASCSSLGGICSE